MTVTVLLDLVVAGLLVTAIGYCVLLNRRLAALRADKAQLDETVRSLAEVSVRAETGIAKLRETAEKVGRSLQQKIEAGASLRDDLGYMVDRGAGLADRLEGSIRARRDDERPPAPAGRPDPKPQAPAPEESAGAMHHRVREILRRIDPTGPAVKLAAKPEASPPQAAEEPAPVAGFPSRAERELRRALEGHRR
jgi:hypothetical protein